MPVWRVVKRFVYADFRKPGVSGVPYTPGRLWKPRHQKVIPLKAQTQTPLDKVKQDFYK